MKIQIGKHAGKVDNKKTRQNASLCSDETETEAAPAWNGVQRVPTRATEEDWEIVGKFEDLKIILE